MLVSTTKSKATREFAFTIDDFVAGMEVTIGVTMENVADDATELRVAEVGGDLLIGSNLTARD